MQGVLPKANRPLKFPAVNDDRSNSHRVFHLALEASSTNLPESAPKRVGTTASASGTCGTSLGKTAEATVRTPAPAHGKVTKTVETQLATLYDKDSLITAESEGVPWFSRIRVYRPAPTVLLPLRLCRAF